MNMDVPIEVGLAARRGDAAGWQRSRRQRALRLTIVAVAHLGFFAMLWRSVAAVAPAIVVPVSLQMFVPQAEQAKTPEPLPQRTPVPKRIDQPKVQQVEPEVPVVSSFSLPVSPPELRAAPPPAAPVIAPETVSSVPKIQLPSSTADYFSNPAPAYPPLSKRLQEQGRVLLYVLVDAQGAPLKVELKSGSGFSRLDEAALDVVQRWKFVPGTRNGVPESMWVEVPIEFRLRT
ncbi:MAG: TonB family protein [Burkholderiales bacterium]|nr:TonB family protein [Burkholderiales bacterium]